MFFRQVADAAVELDELAAVPESEPEPPDAGLLAPAAGAAVDAVDEAAGADVPPLPPLPLRKSVTYQPVPLSWKPAAVSCFLKVLLAQDGQSVNGASDTFCNTSLAKPQDSQR